MKKIKMILPMLIVLAAAFTAFAFKPAAKTTSIGWYVLNPSGDPQEPTDYTLDPNFDEETMCLESRDVCAIEAEGSTYPDFNYGDLNTDSDVKRITHKGE